MHEADHGKVCNRGDKRCKDSGLVNKSSVLVSISIKVNLHTTPVSLFREFGVRMVAIMQLLHRSCTRHVGVDRFNENIDVINEKQL